MRRSAITGVIIALAAITFQGTKKFSTADVVAGRYGVNVEYGQVALQLNADNTFQYCDRTISTSPLLVIGHWEQRGPVVILKDYKSDRKIHSRWKVESDCKCIRSRKALEWRRLCLLQPTK